MDIKIGKLDDASFAARVQKVRDQFPDVARRTSTESYQERPMEGGQRPYDPITAPAHYTSSGVEVIDAIDAWGLDHHLACVVKYVARAGKKSTLTELEDLRKAKWYLERAIAKRGGK